jgi:hypothetical protein
MFLKVNHGMMLEIEEKVKGVLGIKNPDQLVEEVESDD